MNALGNRVAIGCYSDHANGSELGHVKVFEYAESSWYQLGDEITGEGEGG